DVDERALGAVRPEKLAGKAGMPSVDVTDQLAQGGAFGGDGPLAPNAGSQHGWDAYVGHRQLAERSHRGAAERLVVDQLMNGRVVAAQRAARIARDLHFVELHAQAVEQQQPIDKWLTQLADDLDGLARVYRADD